MKSKLILVVALLAFVGCSVRQRSPEEVAAFKERARLADYGAIPQAPEEQIRKSLEDVLFDPYSAVIKCAPLIKAFKVEEELEH